MIKRLEKAVKDLEQRTGSRLAIKDYDYVDGGMQQMTFPGARYALWCYAHTYINADGERCIIGCSGDGTVIGHFGTQAEACDMINGGEFDNRLTNFMYERITGAY